MNKILLSIQIFILSVSISFSQVTHNVSITSNFTFVPSSLTIAAGDTVIWTNTASFGHTTTSGSSNGSTCTSDGNWDSGTMAANAKFKHKFTTDGVFPYFCNIHCSMTGSITVGNVSAVQNSKYSQLNVSVFPNPFSESSTLQFNLLEGGKVKVELFNMMGIKVYESSEETFGPGEQSLHLLSSQLTNGMFMYKLYVNGIPSATSYIIKEKQ